LLPSLPCIRSVMVVKVYWISQLYDVLHVFWKRLATVLRVISYQVL